MQWSSVDLDTELCLARSPTEITDKCSDYLNSDHSSRRQAPVERESLPEILDPVPDAEVVSCLKNVTMFMSPEVLAREVARVQLLPTGKEGDGGSSEDSRPLVRTGGFWTTTPLFAHADRSLDVSGWEVGGVVLGVKRCENTHRATVVFF